MDQIHQLQACAAATAAFVAPGCRPAVVEIRDESGRVLLVLPIPAAVATAVAAPAEPDPPVGWNLAGAVGRWEGVAVPGLSGRKLAVLRLLLATLGPVTVEQLRRAWDGYAAEEGTVRWQVGDLRKCLKAGFPGYEGDPVESTGAGYELKVR